MEFQKIKIVKIKENSEVNTVCGYCEKKFTITTTNYCFYKKLNNSKIYCPFCLRNKHHHKSCRNILPLSFRSIIGYYFYKIYKNSINKEIIDMIKKHKLIGLECPILSYDEETFMWYLNFNHVGNKKEFSFVEVKNVLKHIFKTFEINKKIDEQAEKNLWNKFEKSLDLFYFQRKRPKNKRFLIPTIEDSSSINEKSFLEKTKNFTPKCFDFVE